MYSTLPLKKLVPWLVFPPLLIFAMILLKKGNVPSLTEAIGLANKIVGGWGLFLLFFGSGSQWWRPWRLFWRISILQRILFPDLNGVWRGSTRSNWPSIKAMYDAYEGQAAYGCAGPLDQVPLEESDIELTITASFFRLRVEGKPRVTGGDSHSISAKVEWNDHLERFELNYVYIQNTPNPSRTDESTHHGAARLNLDMEANQLTGEYWTRRSWRSGLNTAGLLQVVKA